MADVAVTAEVRTPVEGNVSVPADEIVQEAVIVMVTLNELVVVVASATSKPGRHKAAARVKVVNNNGTFRRLQLMGRPVPQVVPSWQNVRPKSVPHHEGTQGVPGPKSGWVLS